ncbi:lipopolysaccharide biosynthesis protein [Marseilla massiliensis]|uniref:Lipopolysaccharide biosynthesis protein n=2 Tax=Marseilla massiliensis TaxID=1841864 RepID=A0A938WRK1_9BACT|nr:oligosaccharide flippase family protein [Marseilla massiliensis]MBM6673381.1 lipopolysaccharide biosynthesis protein [Marseilla massiliensis]
MSDTSVNNKRIAKNTLLLYMRTLFIMLVTLYTSRVVLNTLGVTDYGVYNVVGGVVAMFGFINGSMSSATQRYITFALGKGDMKRLQTVFSTSLQIHFLIAALIVVLGETVGLWFMYTQMQIPADRMDAAFWVLQCSIVSTVVMIVSVPYNADIIAHEKMSVFAYISILEAVLKFAIVYALVISPFDKLIFYAFLILAVQLLIRFCYNHYCNRHFEESKYRHVWDKSFFKEMTSFAGWSMFGNLAGVLFGQGLNMLLNVFFGPVVNAARAVAVQVQSAIQQFIGNFQMALNPQITKTYAKGEMEDMHKLMFRSARFSFYLLFFLSLPVLFETNFILTVWLKTVPDNTVVFLRIMICTSLIYTLSNPLMVANQATGKVRKYQAICGSILLMILPVSYVCLKLGCPAYSVFLVHFAVESITQLVRMVLLRPLIGIRIVDYIKNIYTRVLFVVVLSVIAPFIIYDNMDDTVARFFVVCLICMLSVGTVAYTIGLSKNERTFVRSKVVAFTNKIFHK